MKHKIHKLIFRCREEQDITSRCSKGKIFTFDEKLITCKICKRKEE